MDCGHENLKHMPSVRKPSVRVRLQAASELFTNLQGDDFPLSDTQWVGRGLMKLTVSTACYFLEGESEKQNLMSKGSLERSVVGQV